MVEQHAAWEVYFYKERHPPPLGEPQLTVPSLISYTLAIPYNRRNLQPQWNYPRPVPRNWELA